MRITFDPAKRDETIRSRGIDFADAATIFAGDTLDYPDLRKDYGEVRMITVGRLRGRMVVMVWTQRGDARHVISLRKANAREQARFANRLGQG
ncbi:BrnT family toxin [Rhodopseudomonas pseudopalustris]|uniref:Uncharacterized protein n=1 Tax=Rhodopseudomonas pseudopalustris TaxID=1513892 RepID=A0A1H8NV99_9BRAD|nr:BrnT family toxin [Rhodopseudomonas pseudopalustris]SEO33497.1 hypothetical protein SAMN05444123_102286 [Rhodopseudomonas pseudopalustris]